MPALNYQLLLFFSIPTIFIALTLSPSLRFHVKTYVPFRPGTKNPALRPDDPDVFCYGSITTIDEDDRELAPGCLALNANGTFGEVFAPEAMEVDEMRKRGWGVDLSAHVVPGLWDGHAHLLGYGEMLGSVKLYGADSLEGLFCTPPHAQQY